MVTLIITLIVFVAVIDIAAGKSLNRAGVRRFLPRDKAQTKHKESAKAAKYRLDCP
jgi:hypothetical protein